MKDGHYGTDRFSRFSSSANDYNLWSDQENSSQTIFSCFSHWRVTPDMGLEWVAGASASQNAIVSFILEPEIRSETIIWGTAVWAWSCVLIHVINRDGHCIPTYSQGKKLKSRDTNVDVILSQRLTQRWSGNRALVVNIDFLIWPLFPSSKERMFVSCRPPSFQYRHLAFMFYFFLYEDIQWLFYEL